MHVQLSMWYISQLSLLLVLISAQGSYRRRAGHAAVLAGDKLVISGGLVSYDDGYPWCENKTWVLDLSSSWTNSSVVPSSIPRPPSYRFLIQESLWYDQSRGCVFAFGGEVSQDGYIQGPRDGGVGIPNEFLWKLCPDDSDNNWSWTEVLGDNSKEFPAGIVRTTLGASAADGNGSYSIGGVVFNWTTQKNSYTRARHNVPGLLEFDFATQMLTNSSDDGGYFAAEWTETEEEASLAGSMIFAPPFGSQGVFILVGGQSNKSGEIQHWLDNITIFDPSTRSWYSQEATGDVPQPLTMSGPVRFNHDYCFFGVQDNEFQTFDIFIYGGFSGGDAYYILSLPSFKWFSSDVVHLLPRRTQQTCTATNNSQMIMIGGLDPDQKSTLTPPDPQNWLASRDPWIQGIGVFDMTELKYKSSYNASAAAYASPTVVKRYYQNNVRYPTWSNQELEGMFTKFSVTNGSSNSTYMEHPTKLSGGAIAGIVVAAVVVVSLSGLFVIWKIRRRTATTGQTHDTGSTFHLRLNEPPESHSLQNITPQHPPPSYHEREVSARESGHDQRCLVPAGGTNSPERDAQGSKNVEAFGVGIASGSGQNASRPEVPLTSTASPVRPSFEAPPEVPDINIFPGRGTDYISGPLSRDQTAATDRMG